MDPIFTLAGVSVAILGALVAHRPWLPLAWWLAACGAMLLNVKFTAVFLA